MRSPRSTKMLGRLLDGQPSHSATTERTSARRVRACDADVGYDEDHPSASARSTLDRLDPGRRRRRSRGAPPYRRDAGWRPVALRRHVELAVAEREPVRIRIPEPHRPDPDGRSHDAGAEPNTKSYSDCSSHHGGSDRPTDDRGADTATDEYAGPDRSPNEDALGPSQLGDDRRELAHRAARHRDVADTQALAALEQELAQRCA